MAQWKVNETVGQNMGSEPPRRSLDATLRCPSLFNTSYVLVEEKLKCV
jgi:hypothetical protein